MKKYMSIAGMIMIALSIAAAEPVAARPEVIVINEVASTGAYDFVELMNLGSEDALFDGSWSLIDDLEGSADGDKPAVIPAGTVIPANGFLLIAPYKVQLLSSKVPKGIPDEAIALRSFALGSKDSVTLLQGSQIVDRFSWDTAINSYGRSPADRDTLTDLLIPTPGAANRQEIYHTGELPVKINEVCSKGLDYIELYNTSDRDYQLEPGSWELHDAGHNDVFRFPEAAVIPARGFLTIYPDLVRLPLSARKNSYASTAGNRFGLGGSDRVFLKYDGKIVDMIGWRLHAASTGRLPDGGDLWVADLFLTPGRTNRK